MTFKKTNTFYNFKLNIYLISRKIMKSGDTNH